MGYEVLVDELTVHKTVSKLPQDDGSTFYQNGMGKTYYLGEVIPDEEVAENIRDALDEGGALADSLSMKLKKVSEEESEDTARRLGVPFAGFDDMDEDDLLTVMRHLPSATIQRIKEYEAGREGRDRIVNYNIGYGVSPDDHQEDRVGSQAQEPDDDKAVAEISFRETPAGGKVVAGEGITGTGDPQVKPGSRKAEEKSSIKSAARKAGARKSTARRGRRERQPKADDSGSGSGSSGSGNE